MYTSIWYYGWSVDERIFNFFVFALVTFLICTFPVREKEKQWTRDYEFRETSGQKFKQGKKMRVNHHLSDNYIILKI